MLTLLRLVGQPQPLSYHYSTTITPLLHQLYTNPSIPTRISTLKSLPLDLPLLSPNPSPNPSLNPQQPPLSLPQFHYQFTLPPNIKLTTAKQLLEFHKINRTESNVRILHALAFIQFNAFQAYADTYLRFGFGWAQGKGKDKGRGSGNWGEAGVMREFREQIRSVAIDEGQHCLLLINRLKSLGHEFGNSPVISNLNQTVSQTNQSLLQRLALISIVHEGRGIRSIDRLIQKVQFCKDVESCAILRKIQEEETGHFRVGLKWFWHFLRIGYGEGKGKGKGDLGMGGDGFGEYVSGVLEQINRKYKVKITESDLKPPQSNPKPTKTPPQPKTEN